MLRRLSELVVALSLTAFILGLPDLCAVTIAPTAKSKSQFAANSQFTPHKLLVEKPRTRAMQRENNKPPLALCLPVKVESVHDGDTGTVIVSFALKVRYIDCWAPELKDPGGKESAESAQQSVGKNGRLYIDLNDVTNVSELLTFGRVVGEVWIDGQTESESQRQVRLKYASTRKGNQLGE